MNYIYVGKIVNTFGIKGELKIVSRFEMPERVYQKGNILRINNNDYEITNVRFHKNNYLVEFNSIKDINEIEHLIGYDVLFNKDDLKLNNNEYLISELIDYKVYDNDDLVGLVTDYDDNQVNPLIKVDNRFFIPLKGDFIIKVDKSNKEIKAHNLKGLII